MPWATRSSTFGGWFGKESSRARNWAGIGWWNAKVLSGWRPREKIFGSPFGFPGSVSVTKTRQSKSPPHHITVRHV